MQNKDAEVGMKVKRIWNDHKDVKKGSVYTIKKVVSDDVQLEGLGSYWYDLSLFEPIVMELEQSTEEKVEPVNKFEVGDEVNYYNEKFEIWGIIYNTHLKKYNYALINNEGEIAIVIERQISPLKKLDKLEVGDKFKAFDTKYKVVAIGYDDIYECTDYYSKAINGERPGTMKSILSKTIQEIIYD